MEPEPITEKKPHHVFGNPNAPLLKDVVKDMRNAGRAKSTTWESSVLKYIRPYREKAEWKTTRFCKEVAGCMRMMSGRYETVKKVLEIWDGYSLKTRSQVFSLDRACDEAQVDRDEFAGLALAAVKNHFRMMALSTVELNLDTIVKASVDFSKTDKKEASAERMRHLEKHGIIDKAATGARVVVQQTNNAPPAPTRSFDDQMADFDKNVIDGEILGETRLLNE